MTYRLTTGLFIAAAFVVMGAQDAAAKEKYVEICYKVPADQVGGTDGPGGTLRVTNALLEVFNNLRTADPKAYDALVESASSISDVDADILSKNLGLDIQSDAIKVQPYLMNKYRFQTLTDPAGSIKLNGIEQSYRTGN